MENNISNAPIFIVVLPRTGSKLVMNMINLNAKADYHISSEVQFFGHSFLGRVLQGRRGVMPIVESERDASGKVAWEAVVNRLYSNEIAGGHWKGLSHGWLKIPKSKLLKTLSESEATAKSIYQTILSTQEREFKAYGDKSGPNLYFIGKILEWFPNGKVIHIVRDPRAILTSQHKRLTSILEHRSKAPWFITAARKAFLSPIIVLYVLTYWGYAMRIDRKFSRSHPKNYMLVQYEELVLNPKETTMKICSFLSIPWDVSMLHPPKSDSSFIDPREVVKSVDRGTGIDVAALERWREHMKLWMNLAFRFYGSIFYPKALERFGYLDKRSG